MLCSVPSCSNATEHAHKSVDITFHALPTEQQLRAAWVKAVGIQDNNLPASAVICSKHFLDDDITTTENGLKQIRAGVIPSAVQFCLICLDTDSKLILMSKYQLEEAYKHLTGRPVYDKGNLKQTLCLECAQRLLYFTQFRNRSLRASSLLTELVNKYELITYCNVKQIDRKHNQLQSTIAKKIFEPNHSDIYFLHPEIIIKTELAEKLHTVNETIPVEYERINGESMVVDEHHITVKLEMTSDHENYANNDADDAVSKNILNRVDYSKAVAAEGIMKNETITDCFEEFSDKEAYNLHVVSHSKEYSEDYTSKWEHPSVSNTTGQSLTTFNIQHTLEQSSKSTHLEHTTASSKTFQIQVKDKGKKLRPLKAETAIKNRKDLMSEDTKPTQNSLVKQYCMSGLHKGVRKQDSMQKTPKLAGADSYDNFAKQFICDICQEIFVRRSDLVEHVKAELHVTKTFDCKLCLYKSVEKKDLLTHMMSTHAEKIFPCKFCDFITVKSISLARHMGIHTGEEPYGCELCEYRCADYSTLVSHKRTHTGERLYPCNFCEYKSTQSHVLINHMRTHTGEKPFSCKFCEYKCAQKTYLVSHMTTHTGEKPFSCKFCAYTCARKAYLVSHVRTHTGEKPFSCNFCEWKFSNRTHLVRHVRTHTNKKPYACKMCEYKCAEKQTLVRHMKNHTVEELPQEMTV